MDAKSLIAAVAVFTAAGTALADTVNVTNTVGAKTRAEVRAELERAYAAGEYANIVVPEAAGIVNVAYDKTGAKTSAEPKRDLAARTPHIVVPEAAEIGTTPSTLTRAEVRAELERSYAAGQYAAIVVPEAAEHYTTVASVRTRDEVRREAIQAAKSKQAKNAHNGG